MDLESTHTA